MNLDQVATAREILAMDYPALMDYKEKQKESHVFKDPKLTALFNEHLTVSRMRWMALHAGITFDNLQS